ncbi:hypothetical protein ACEPPN_004069 [Leptodophora sp. 'Broadleaf-Isolate-01']
MYMSPRSFMMDPFTAQASMQRAAFVRASADAARGIAVPPVHQWGDLNPNFDFGGGRLGNGAEIEDSKGDAGQAYEADDAGYSKPMPSPVLTPAVQVQVHKFFDAVSVPVQAVRPLLPIDGFSLGQIQLADPLAGVSQTSALHQQMSTPSPTIGPYANENVERERNFSRTDGVSERQYDVCPDSECQEIFMTGSHQRSVGLAVTRSKRKRVGGVKEEPPTKLPLKAALAETVLGMFPKSPLQVPGTPAEKVVEATRTSHTERANKRASQFHLPPKKLDFAKLVGYKYNTNNLQDKRELGDVLGSENARMLGKMGDGDWKDRVELEKKLVEDEKEDASAGGVELRMIVESADRLDVSSPGAPEHRQP